MFKLPINQAFLASSLTKAIQPFSTTAPSEALIAAASTTAKSLAACLPKSSLSKSSLSKSSVAKMLPPSAMAPFTLWAISLLCISIMTTSIIVDAAPKKHTSAPDNLVSAKGFTVSATSPLPLQLQLEAHVAGNQKLAYLPTSGPAMDFYYLNYRPSYIAGESKLDFWMLTPQGSTPPKTASLELFDEYGKIRLATLVPAGTEVPAATANKNEPFLWKSWTIPKTLKSDFEFSEKFRVVLRTSSGNAKQVEVMGNKKNNKRAEAKDEEDVLLVKNKNKHLNAVNNAETVDSTVVSANNKNNKVNSAAVAPNVMVVQDRQFRIKGLKATPGGQPNPAKLRVNSVAPAPAAPKAPSNDKDASSSEPSTGPTFDVASGQIDKEHTQGKISSAYKLHARVSSMATIAAIALAMVFIA